MSVAAWGWIGLTIALFITTFGFIFCVTAVTVVIFFLLGGIALLITYQDQSNYDAYVEQNIDVGGLYKVVSAMRDRPRVKLKTDRRLTGSQIIDDQLQEILTYLIRDYVLPWYDTISSDDETPHQIRVTAQKIIVSLANRMKEIDWMPYLTTRLVDDAASHLRLFRQARAKTKRVEGVGGGQVSLENAFFDHELAMEDHTICRDHLCLDPDREKSFLRELTQVLLYLLSPEEDFHCSSLCVLVREIFVNAVLVPLLDLVSDPDYINQIIIWLCSAVPVTSEVFLMTLRQTDNTDELAATRELLVKEMATLRSRDSGGEDDAWVKQQLSSLVYVKRVVDSRLDRLEEGADPDSAELPSTDYSKLLAGNHKLFMLPLDVVLKNNVALSYFIDYMATVGAQAYLFFYLNVEGWRVSMEQQLSDLALNRLHVPPRSISPLSPTTPTSSYPPSLPGEQSTPEQILDRIRQEAYSIFEQYLSEKAGSRLRLDESMVKRLLLRIRTETPSDTWFDEVQAAVFDKLKTEDRFLNGFRQNVAYVKLLAELELLKEPLLKGGGASDEDDEEGSEELSLGSETTSLASLPLDGEDCGEVSNQTTVSVTPASPTPPASDCKVGPYTLFAEIIETAIMNEKGKTFGIYAMSVTKKYDSGHKESWHIYRRYSDFYELHQKVRDKFSDLSKLAFPGKKTFYNTERRTLERRMRMLNDYVQTLLRSTVLASHPTLRPLLLSFLDPGTYDKGLTSGQIVKTLDSLLVNPLRAVMSLPDNLMSTVDGVMDGLSKALHAKQLLRQDSEVEACKVGASLHAETDDNVPLRIMLLLMTEVFELKSRNQWLRRRMVTLLRQILHTMFGDIVNRRIVDYVFALTSPQQVADYLRTFKHSYWPHGVKAEPKLPRDEMMRARTRVAAKITLLSSLSDELKHILGSETSRRGLLTVFQLFQHPVLNRRLLYVLLEGTLTTLFQQDHPLHAIFTRLHSRSPRVLNHNVTRSNVRR